MRIQLLLMITHGLTAAALAPLIVAAYQSGAPERYGGAAAIALVILMTSSWFVANRVRMGLAMLETVVADYEQSTDMSSGIFEIDRCAERIGESASSWETVAANTRKQAREFHSMMLLLNRRDAGPEPSSEHLRDLLSSLGNSLYSHMQQIEQGTAEIEQHTKAIAEGAEAQGHAIIQTTTYVSQMSSAIDTVSNNATAVKSAIQQAAENSTAAMELVRELNAGMQQIRTESQMSEKKLRGLIDPSRQVTAILGTIGDIAARTDLLALNASIESIRAGEHGRGFAVVADEVRKLAEQASDATREISSLIDSMQLVTQESIQCIMREREHVETEVNRAGAAEKSLEEITSVCADDVKYIREITDASTHQLKLAQEVVLAVEQISKIAKTSRGSADSVGWTMKSMCKSSPQFSAIIDQLRRCGDASDPDGGAAAVADIAGALSPPASNMAEIG